MDLTIEEYQKAKKAGYSTERIAQLLTLDSPKKQTTTTAPKSNVQGEIASRGDFLANVTRNVESPNPVRKGMAFLETAGAPFTLVESGLLIRH